jgi:transcriptional regulator with XRE-family HTH domain
MADKEAPNILGDYLSSIRTAKRLTLREVEEATHHAISNAYLSQLEHGRISNPSPNILHSLAVVYGVPYEVLMEKAGYIVTTSDRSGDEKHGRIATFAGENLTPEEEDALLEYLAFLRSRKKRREK